MSLPKFSATKDSQLIRIFLHSQGGINIFSSQLQLKTTNTHRFTERTPKTANDMNIIKENARKNLLVGLGDISQAILASNVN